MGTCVSDCSLQLFIHLFAVDERLNEHFSNHIDVHQLRLHLMNASAVDGSCQPTLSVLQINRELTPRTQKINKSVFLQQINNLLLT